MTRLLTEEEVTTLRAAKRLRVDQCHTVIEVQDGLVYDRLLCPKDRRPWMRTCLAHRMVRRPF